MTETDVRDAFRKQVIACRTLGSPLTADVCEILANALQTDQGEIARRILGWQGDPSPRADAVPLRLCGGLHALVLTGRDDALKGAYASKKPTSEVLLQALTTHEKYLLGWLEGPPQTNEVGRAASIIAAARFATERYGLPIRAFELGASAGLNLNFQHFHLMPKGAPPPSGPEGPHASGIFGKKEAGRVELCPEWQGDVPATEIDITEAEGVDLRPVDPIADELRLLAYCWADQTARINRLREAIKVARTYLKRVTAGDAGAWLTDRLSQPADGKITFVYHTIAWQYFPPSTQKICEDALQSAGAASSPEAPLVHFSMEGDGGEGAAMTLRLWDGEPRTWRLGRIDFHGRWVKWQPELM